MSVSVVNAPLKHDYPLALSFVSQLHLDTNTQIDAFHSEGTKAVKLDSVTAPAGIPPKLMCNLDLNHNGAEPTLVRHA